MAVIRGVCKKCGHDLSIEYDDKQFMIFETTCGNCGDSFWVDPETETIEQDGASTTSSGSDIEIEIPDGDAGLDKLGRQIGDELGRYMPQPAVSQIDEEVRSLRGFVRMRIAAGQGDLVQNDLENWARKKFDDPYIYLSQLMIKKGVREREELKYLRESFRDDPDFKYAVQFGKSALFDENIDDGRTISDVLIEYTTAIETRGKDLEDTIRESIALAKSAAELVKMINKIRVELAQKVTEASNAFFDSDGLDVSDLDQEYAFDFDDDDESDGDEGEESKTKYSLSKAAEGYKDLFKKLAELYVKFKDTKKKMDDLLEASTMRDEDKVQAKKDLYEQYFQSIKTE